MGVLLLALLIGVPLIEIGLFIEIGGLIGLWATLALVVVTAVLGSWQLRLQGLATLARARGQLDRGQLPAVELFDGFCLLVAGALLLTPGFLTDAVGLLLFVPAVRRLIRQFLSRHLHASAHARIIVDGMEVEPGPGAGPRARRGEEVIEGEYEDVTDTPEEGRDPDGRASGGRGRR